MKRYVFASVAVLAVLAVTLCIYAQPAGGGGMMGGGGFGGGGFGGGGFGGFGGRGMRGGPVARPDRAARLADIKTLETQVAALRAAIEKAPATDPNIAALEDDALTKFMDVYTPELAAVNAIQQTLNTMEGTTGGGGRGGRGGFGGGVNVEQLSELRTLANDEKATKVVARLDELIQAAQAAATRRGAGRGAGGGAGRGAGGGAGAGGAGRGAGRGAGGGA